MGRKAETGCTKIKQEEDKTVNENQENSVNIQAFNS
jgi:hypothetical protein